MYHPALIHDLQASTLPTPCYVIDRDRLTANLRILRDVADRSGARILLAQKAFSAHALYPLIAQYLDGTTASGLYEARLGHEKMGERETHIFSPAYTEREFPTVLSICDHVVFNSVSQWQRHRSTALAAQAQNPHLSYGLRINPEHSTQDHAIYDPCAPGSRLGIRAAQMSPELMTGIDGLHFHTLCEQNSDALESTLAAVEQSFAPYLRQIRWLNLGGGHHITRDDYDRERLIQIIRRLRDQYHVTVYLEPGEAVALNAGFLVTRVIDLIENDGHIAILDASAACHMPDVLEMPYQPPLWNADKNGEKDSKKPYCYKLTGPTCLAGDIIGEYRFDQPLQINDPLIFYDMAIYTMVKNNTFNGMPLPAILYREDAGQIRTLREFGYEDFVGRI